MFFKILITFEQEEKTSDYHIIEGKFLTPLELYLPGLVPKAAQDAHFQMLLPLKWQDENFKPVCVHFAGTGDHVRINEFLIQLYNALNLFQSII